MVLISIQVSSFTTMLASFGLWLLAVSISEVSGLGCFVCSSINGSNPHCEDTFQSTEDSYVTQCKAGRKNRTGVFPGTDCIKMKAELGDGAYITVRQCVVDNGDINSETEIGRIDHCGLMDYLDFNGKSYRGCILTCNTDGCNHGNRISRSSQDLLLLTLMSSLFCFHFHSE